MTTSWKNVKNAPSALGQKNDLIAWIPLEREQMNLYTKFLASKPVRDAANKTGSAISCMNMLKKICDHPSLCVGGAPVEDIADDQLDDVDGDDAELKKSCAGEAAAAVAACVRECKFDADVLERGAPSVEEFADARLVELAVGRTADVRQRTAVPRAHSEAGDGEPYRSAGGDGRGHEHSLRAV